MSGRNLDCLRHAGALDDVEPADRLLCLDERAVRDDRLPVADADGSGPARRRQLVAGHPAVPRLKVVQPGKAFRLGSLGGIGLRLGVHLLNVPADQQQELHIALSNSISTGRYGRRTRRTEIDASLTTFARVERPNWCSVTPRRIAWPAEGRCGHGRVGAAVIDTKMWTAALLAMVVATALLAQPASATTPTEGG